jgi:serine/threonine-protein kinase mTOR
MLSKPRPDGVPSYGMATAADDFYQKTVIKALVNILNDSSLSRHHYAAIEVIMAVFKTQGLKCVAFLPDVEFNHVLAFIC